MDHILDPKTSLNKFERTEIIQNMHNSNHNGMKLLINNGRKLGKFTNMRKLNNTLNK